MCRDHKSNRFKIQAKTRCVVDVLVASVVEQVPNSGGSAHKSITDLFREIYLVILLGSAEQLLLRPFASKKDGEMAGERDAFAAAA